MLRTTVLMGCFFAGLLLMGCDKGAGVPMTGDPAEPLARVMDKKTLTLGRQVYAANCARCHGQQAEGDADWRTPNAQGHYPPPPLNGTGHAWHHPVSVLRDVIANGSPPGPQARMPAWKDRLSEREMLAVIAWFQSLWPEQVYSAWQEMQGR